MQALNHSQQNPPQLSSSGSDSEPSPAFASSQYLNMMQQCKNENNLDDSLSGAAQSHTDDGSSASLELPIQMPAGDLNDQFQNFNFSHPSNDPFDNSQDMNRRTLTQEQFNAMSQQSAFQGNGEFNLDMDIEAFNRMYPEFNQSMATSQGDQAFQDFSRMPAPGGDMSVPQNIAEQSIASFPSSDATHDQSGASCASSEWAGSRSSSISAFSRDGHFAQTNVAPQPQSSSTTSQWQPGQSVPVDFHQLTEEFRQAAQSRQPHQQQFLQEQPLAWPMDEAYHERSNSQTAGIIQSMGSVGLKTPQPQQHAAFKSPTPGASLATRRQRSKPAPLGLASLRSQSYSASSQPGSPGHVTHNQSQANHGNLGPAQPLRRIKSSNMVNGVAQGRIQKPTPGSAQRSPLNWTFADVMKSPKGIRQVSSQNSSNLAPPTPLSPREHARVDHSRQFQNWQTSSGQVSRQASISENDIEQNTTTALGLSDNFSSPPHTPLYPPQPQFAQQRVGKNAILENTPPQSAPATQLSFAGSTFKPPPNQPIPHQTTTMPQAQPSQQAMQHMFAANQHQMMAADQQFPMGNFSGPHQPQFTLTASDPMANPQMQYSFGGLPMMDVNGNFQMAIPQSHYQLVPHPPPHPSASAPPLNHTPPMHYPFPVTTSTSPSLQTSVHGSKQAPQPELCVHEYQPPADVKRAATPRKVPAESAPKSYTFANQTPEHFEKGKRAAAGASQSPVSNSSGN